MKKQLALLLIALLLIPSNVWAHSKLVTSTPAADSRLDVSPGRIEMTFDTKIEKLSNFKLLTADGVQIETGSAAVDGDTMTGELPLPLENGDYLVQWVIIGADGHAVDGQFSFAVDAPAPPQTDEPITEETAPEATQPPAEPATPTPSAQPESATAATDDAGSSKQGGGLVDEGLLPFIIIAIIIAGVLTLALLARRRKK